MTELETYIEIRKRARMNFHKGLAYVLTSAEILGCDGLYIDLEHTEDIPTIKEIVENLSRSFINYEERKK